MAAGAGAPRHGADPGTPCGCTHVHIPPQRCMHTNTPFSPSHCGFWGQDPWVLLWVADVPICGGCTGVRGQGAPYHGIRPPLAAWSRRGGGPTTGTGWHRAELGACGSVGAKGMGGGRAGGGAPRGGMQWASSPTRTRAMQEGRASVNENWHSFPQTVCPDSWGSCTGVSPLQIQRGGVITSM